METPFADFAESQGWKLEFIEERDNDEERCAYITWKATSPNSERYGFKIKLMGTAVNEGLFSRGREIMKLHREDELKRLLVKKSE